MPGVATGREGSEADGGRLGVVEARDADAWLGRRQQRDADVHIDGEREDEAAVVVGVLTDEVDPPRRPGDDDLRAALGQRRVERDEPVDERAVGEVACGGHASDGRARSGVPLGSRGTVEPP